MVIEHTSRGVIEHRPVSLVSDAVTSDLPNPLLEAKPRLRRSLLRLDGWWLQGAILLFTLLLL
jgi:hypothetical protein